MPYLTAHSLVKCMEERCPGGRQLRLRTAVVAIEVRRSRHIAYIGPKDMNDALTPLGLAQSIAGRQGHRIRHTWSRGRCIQPARLHLELWASGIMHLAGCASEGVNGQV